jgi:hypothetical protein
MASNSPSPSNSTTNNKCSSATTQQLMARLGLDDNNLRQAKQSARRTRAMEKIMVAELHHMQGELAQEKARLKKENAAIQKVIQSLKAQQQQQQQQGATPQNISKEMSEPKDMGLY